MVETTANPGSRRGDPAHQAFQQPLALARLAGEYDHQNGWSTSVRIGSVVPERNGVVIVGGGLAAATAATTLRAEGYAGRVLMISEEAEPPYERPPLSKEYLLGSSTRESTWVHEPDWYQDNGVELLLGTRVVDLDAAGRSVLTDSGHRAGFDRLLLATGAVPRRLNLPGGDADDVHYLRSLDDSDRLRTALAPGSRRVVVVGGGWIGLETAAAARAHGNQVTIVDPQPTPLHAALGPEIGETFAQLHRDHQVFLRMRTGVTGFQTDRGRLTGLTTTAGDVLPADVAVVGVGVRPTVELAEAAGLAVSNGVLVDAALRSSHPEIYAAGDIANADNPLLGHRLRVEHWHNARTSGAAAARSMLGQPVVHDPVPYFFTDQYDLGMEYAGHTGPGNYDRIVIRGDQRDRKFVAFWLAGGRVVAGMNVNIWDINESLQRLVRSGRSVDPDTLADPAQPLDELSTDSEQGRR